MRCVSQDWPMLAFTGLNIKGPVCTGPDIIRYHHLSWSKVIHIVLFYKLSSVNSTTQ